MPVQCTMTTRTNQRLSYLHWQGHGAPLLLLHGGALTAHTWDLVCLALADDFHCVALDLRGHGDSGHAEEYTIQSCVDDVIDLADALDWSQMHVSGMSLGGNIAFHAAAQQRERIMSLTMVDVGAGVNFDATRGMRSFIEQARNANSVDAVIESVMAFQPHSDRDLIRYRYMHLMRPMPDGTWDWRQDNRKPHDYEHILGKIAEMPGLAHLIECPILLARGERSNIFSERSAAEFAAMFPNALWLNIPGAGHNVQEDNPKALAAAIRATAMRAIPDA